MGMTGMVFLVLTIGFFLSFMVTENCVMKAVKVAAARGSAISEFCSLGIQAFVFSLHKVSMEVTDSLSLLQNCDDDDDDADDDNDASFISIGLVSTYDLSASAL